MKMKYTALFKQLF